VPEQVEVLEDHAHIASLAGNVAVTKLVELDALRLITDRRTIDKELT
jgi:hypothetical protein